MNGILLGIVPKLNKRIGPQAAYLAMKDGHKCRDEEGDVWWLEGDCMHCGENNVVGAGIFMKHTFEIIEEEPEPIVKTGEIIDVEVKLTQVMHGFYPKLKGHFVRVLKDE